MTTLSAWLEKVKAECAEPGDGSSPLDWMDYYAEMEKYFATLIAIVERQDEALEKAKVAIEAMASPLIVGKDWKAIQDRCLEFHRAAQADVLKLIEGKG